MSTRPADFRFLVPSAATRVFTTDSKVDEACDAAGLQVVGVSDLVDSEVAYVGRRDVRVVLRARVPSIVVTGWSGRWRLRRAGYEVQRLLVRSGPAGPRMVAPVHGAALRWALLDWGRPYTRLRVIRNRLVCALARIGVPLPRSTWLLATIARAAQPWPVGAATGSVPGVGAAQDWCYFAGAGDELQRAALFVFERGALTPGWLVKITRAPGNTGPFDNDERGLALLGALDPTTRAHVPKLLGRFMLDGLDASIEPAAAGRPLVDVLEASGPKPPKRAIIDAVIEWIRCLGVASSGPDSDLEGERERLRRDIPGARELLAALVPLKSVLAHNDLGTWNIVAKDQSTFTVLDWESARRPAFPLWDLLYFAVDAFVMMEGALPVDRQLDTAVALLRGTHPSSQRFFAAVREYVHDMEIPHDAVAPLATLCWLHHSRSHLARADALAASARVYGQEFRAAPMSHLACLAERWLVEPGLGATWDAWRGESVSA